MAGSRDYSVLFRLLGRDEASGPISRVRGLLSGLRQQASVTSRALGMHRVGDGLRGVMGAFGNLRAQISGLGIGLAGLIGGGSAVGFLHWITGAADAGDEVAKLGRRVGLTAEQISGFQYAMQLTGGGGKEDFNSAIQTFTKNIGDAANGVGRAKPIFEAMGLQLRDAAGHVKPTNQLLNELADKMAKIKDPAERQAVAMRLMGESGSKMALVLEGGSKAMADYVEEGRAYLGMTEKLATASEEFKDSQQRVGAAFTFLQNGLAENLLPLLVPLQEKFAAFIRSVSPTVIARFSVAIGDLVGQVSEWFTATDGGTSRAAKALTSFMDGLSAFGDTVSAVSKFVGGWGNMLGIVAAIMAAPMLNAILGITTAFVRLGLVMLTNPIIAVVAAIAAAVYLIYRNWDGIAAYFSGLWASVKATFTEGLDLVVGALSGIDMMAIGAGWVSSLQAGVAGLWDGFVGWIKSKIAGLLSIVPDGLKAHLGLSMNADAADPAAGVDGGPGRRQARRNSW